MKRIPALELPMTTLNLRIDDTLERDLEALSEVEKRSKSDIVREILRKHMALAKFSQARSQLKPLGLAAGVLTDEDVFDRVS
jgi:predicted transcriptional regulator